jgi:hypothetical protein
LGGRLPSDEVAALHRIGWQESPEYAIIRHLIEKHFRLGYWIGGYGAAFLLFLAIIVGVYFFFFRGKSDAETRDTFHLVKQSGGGKEDSELVFLGNYGDYLVCVPFHRDTKNFDSFVILKMPQAENTRLTFTHEQVGPLQPVKGKSVEVKP